MKRNNLQPVIGAEVLECLDRGNEVATCSRWRILFCQAFLVAPSIAIFPSPRLWTVEEKRFRTGIVEPGTIDDWEDFDLDAQIHLDTHAGIAVLHLILVMW